MIDLKTLKRLFKGGINNWGIILVSMVITFILWALAN